MWYCKARKRKQVRTWNTVSSSSILGDSYSKGVCEFWSARKKGSVMNRKTLAAPNHSKPPKENSGRS